jgi:hypothetical protein
MQHRERGRRYYVTPTTSDLARHIKGDRANEQGASIIVAWQM